MEMIPVYRSREVGKEWLQLFCGRAGVLQAPERSLGFIKKHY